MKNFKGYSYGIITSVTFGLIPLFTIPLLNNGMSYDSILFYRFLFAAIALAIMLKITGQSYKIEKREIPILLLLGFFYAGSAMFLLLGYNYMGAGVATAIHFTYPVFVSLLLFLFFKERIPWLTWLAIFLAVAGVAIISVKGSDLSVDPWGIFIVVISALAYGSYIVTVNKSRVKNMNGRKLAFYVFSVSTVIFGINSLICEGITPVPSGTCYLNLLLLAVLPTVISNITLVQAVRYIGGTLTSVLGAMEPVTAVLIGTVIFGEHFTIQDVIGVTLIIVAVTIIILSNSIIKSFSTVFKMIRPRHA